MVQAGAVQGDGQRAQGVRVEPGVAHVVGALGDRGQGAGGGVDAQQAAFVGSAGGDEPQGGVGVDPGAAVGVEVLCGGGQQRPVVRFRRVAPVEGHAAVGGESQSAVDGQVRVDEPAGEHRSPRGAGVGCDLDRGGGVVVQVDAVDVVQGGVVGVEGDQHGLRGGRVVGQDAGLDVGGRGER